MVKKRKRNGSDEGVRRAYARLSWIYGIFENFFERGMRKRALDMLDVGKGDFVLNIGFGTGYELLDVVEGVGEKGKVYGIDVTLEMVLRAKKRVEKMEFGDMVFLSEGDARRLGFKDGMFDCVYISEVLEIFNDKDVGIILKEIKRVLKPKGRVCVVDSSEGNGWLIGIYNLLYKLFPNYTSVPINVKKVLKSNGFKVVDEDKVNIFGIFPMEIGVGEKR